MEDMREILRTNYSPVLFVTVTNDCNMNCKYCYTHDHHYKSNCINLGDIATAINTLYPSKVILTGGEPLLHPKAIQQFVLYFEAEMKKHWNILLCTNLLLELTQDRIDAINKCDWLQTTYSVDRFLSADQYKLFSDNFKSLISSCTHLEYRDINVTITEKQLEESTGDLIDKLLELKPTGVGLELLSFNDKDLHSHDEYYEKADEYMSRVFEVLPHELNLTEQGWKKSLDNNMTMKCTVCSDGNSVILDPDGVMKNGCTCQIDTADNSIRQLNLKKFVDKCVDCNLFEYCRGNCKRFGYYCGFPKNTFTKFLDRYKKKV